MLMMSRYVGKDKSCVQLNVCFLNSSLDVLSYWWENQTTALSSNQQQWYGEGKQDVSAPEHVQHRILFPCR